jgi:glutamyl-tRNA reductase
MTERIHSRSGEPDNQGTPLPEPMPREPAPVVEPSRSVEETPTEIPESLRRVACHSITAETVQNFNAIAPSNTLETARSIIMVERVTEAFILATCHRVEVYISTRTPAEEDRRAARTAIQDEMSPPGGTQVHTGIDAIRHLARVTAGLKSPVLGEQEIAGQVSTALETAKEADLIAGVLARSGDMALRTSRKCRAETAIDTGTVSYGSAVCEALAAKDSMPPEQLVLIGAGEIAQQVRSAVTSQWNTCVDVANRSHAPEIPTPEGRYWPLERLSEAVVDADAIVTATGASQPIFDQSAAQAAGDAVVVDLARPNDVSAGARACQELQVIDLEEVVETIESTTNQRMAAVPTAESIIENALTRFIEQERENSVEDVLRELHQKAGRIKAAELERAKNRLDDEADAEAVLEDFASALTGHILAEPTAELRAAARQRNPELIRAARRLFELQTEES